MQMSDSKYRGASNSTLIYIFKIKLFAYVDTLTILNNKSHAITSSFSSVVWNQTENLFSGKVPSI